MTSNDHISDIHAYTTYLKSAFPPQNNSKGAYYEHIAAIQSNKDKEAYMKEMERIDLVYNIRQFEQRQEDSYNIKKQMEEATTTEVNDYSSDDNEYDDDDEGFETVKRR
jgi:hypothetical protein